MFRTSASVTNPLGSLFQPTAIPFALSDKLRVVAVTSARRSSLLPEVPTVEEVLGAKDFHFSNWWGIFAPAKLPDRVAQSLEEALHDSLADEGVQKQMLESGVEPLGLYGKAANDFLDSERQRYTSLAKEAGLSMP